ncbi:hypothetical protein [Maribellus sp. YY47]|uniref:hypothetical protein n=1 Tax=Maribellus sp. YY47 TaxID=2929486 RepID=UPI002000BA75|nr:hypothetical protein [Maribellus sp. YY47]MCK3684555.1 hypothetical protein [Maribellus sp. YY47]
MRNVFLFLLFSVTSLSALAEEDWSWWNDLHGWEEGMPGWRNWLIIAPAYLGPNALPVPEVKKGFFENESEFALSASSHFHAGDPTQDLSGRLFLPFAKGKIAIEMYGVLLEHYAYTEEIRNERFSRDKDGKGVAIGDFYFSTLIQLSRNRKFPNTLFRMTLKTASGTNLEAARYADSPGYFFDVSSSKDFGSGESILFRPYGMIGFYSWQTNDELMLQNDALLYGLGTEFEHGDLRFGASWSGYYGYKNIGDRPMQLNFDLRKDFSKSAISFQYQHGLHDWGYKTLRFSYIWKFNAVK